MKWRGDEIPVHMRRDGGNKPIAAASVRINSLRGFEFKLLKAAIKRAAGRDVNTTLAAK